MNTLISKIIKSKDCFNCNKYYLNCYCEYNCYPYITNQINDSYLYSFYLNEYNIFITNIIENKFIIDIPLLNIKFISDDLTIKDLIEKIQTYMIFQ